MYKEKWYSVRGLFYDTTNQFYEERTVLIKAISSSGALEKAEVSSLEYAKNLGDIAFTGYLETFEVVDDIDSDFPEYTEVFSNMRYSNLSSEEYIKRFLKTGDEVNLD